MEPDWRWEDWLKVGRRCTESLKEMWSLIEDDQLQIQGQRLPSSACHGDHSQPFAIWVYNMRETKSVFYRQWKGREVRRKKQNWRHLRLLRNRRGRRKAVASVYANRVCGKTSNTSFPTNPELWVFGKRVSPIHGVVGRAKQDFLRLGSFLSLRRLRSLYSSYPNNALVL